MRKNGDPRLQGLIRIITRKFPVMNQKKKEKKLGLIDSKGINEKRRRGRKEDTQEKGCMVGKMVSQVMWSMSKQKERTFAWVLFRVWRRVGGKSLLFNGGFIMSFLDCASFMARYSSCETISVITAF